MSDEFDSLDATENAAVEGALNNAKRPSHHIVQTAPVRCRYTKSGVCANVAGFCLCRQANFELPSSHDARTGKTLVREFASSSDVPAVRARPLRGAPPGSLQFPGNAFERSKHVQAPTPWQRRTNLWRKPTSPARAAKRQRSVRVVSRYRRREMTKEEQVVGLIFQVTMWAYIAAAAAYVMVG